MMDALGGYQLIDIVSDFVESSGLLRCHMGYHVWLGEPWDHCMRCCTPYPDQALDHWSE
jgi:hypothetical protein